MEKAKYMLHRKLRMLGVVGLAGILTACAGIKDVDNRWCPPEDEPVVVQDKITLKADALFKFDQGDLNGLLPQGKETLNELADPLKSKYVQINSIELIGHTDRLGPEAYNMRLSQQRADTVKSYLQSGGVDYTMTAVGKGESDPVTTDCKGSVATTALINCLQPDRRVNVIITGIRQD